VHEAGPRDLVRRLEEGQLDLAVVILPVDRPRVATRALTDEELVLAVSAGHPLPHRRSIALAEFEHLPLVMFMDGDDLREATMGAGGRAGFQPILAMQGVEMKGALPLAAAGLAGAFVPASVVTPGGALWPIRFRGDLVAHHWLVLPPRPSAVPAVDAFALRLQEDLAPAETPSR
jgi:DNA-binding transcriptional LysR family regulator